MRTVGVTLQYIRTSLKELMVLSWKIKDLDAHAAHVGKHWWDLIHNEITRQRLSHPSTNWYQDNNQLF